MEGISIMLDASSQIQAGSLSVQPEKSEIF